MDEATRKMVVQEIARHQPRLRALVRCLLVRTSDVDDVLQDVNAVLWEKSDQFQPGTDFWAWASQIARFKALNQLRRYGRERLVFDEALLEQLANMVETRLHDLERRRAALDHCLQQLSPAQRQLIDLRYSDGQTPQSIAQSIGRPEGSVRQTLYRIRQALLACIEGQLALGETAQ